VPMPTFQVPAGATQATVLGQAYAVNNGTIEVSSSAAAARLVAEGWPLYGADPGITVLQPMSGQMYPLAGPLDGANIAFYCPFPVPGGTVPRVYLNGVRQGVGDCSFAGRQVLFTNAPPAGAVIEAEAP
jgi:hypothetical protein